MRVRSWLTLAFLALSVSAQAQATFVNSTASSVSPNGSPSSTVVADAFSVTAGNHVVCGIRWNQDAAQVVSGLADTAGNTYVQSTGGLVQNAGQAMTVFYANNVTGNGSNVVTATFDAAATFQSIICLQHSGVSTSGSFDTYAIGTAASGGSVTSASFTTAQTNELIAAFVSQSFIGTETFVASGTATLRQQAAGNAQGAQSESAATVQSGVTRTMTTTNETIWDMMIYVVAFKTTGSGGGGGGGGGVGGLLLRGIK